MLSILLCLAMLVSYIPMAMTAAAAPQMRAEITGTVADPGTAYTWETMMGTDSDGNRYAGRVWVDKSVFKDGDRALLNTKNQAGSYFDVSLKEDENFQIIFSALGSTMTSKESTTTTGPMDVVLVLDTSTSMDDEDRYGVTRLQRTIEAANKLIDDLLTIRNVRIAIVTYNKDSETVIPLAAYTNGIDLVVTDYYNNGSSDAGVVTAYDNDRKVLGKDSGYTQGTNLQSGIDRGFNILANATDIQGRVPVAIVLTDGQANRASQEGFYELSSHSDKDGTGASNRNLYLSTLLNAAYTKTKIEAHYGKDATVYTVGVDVTTNKVARLLMNPADTANGFNASNSDREIREAYKNFQSWANGQNVTYSGWTFNHNYPTQSGVITDAKIAANINYADNYYDVSNAEIDDTFNQIYEELSSGVFNPISSSTVVEGGTGVENTPLIYVDFIGQHMEIKEIQTVTLFGLSCGVIKNADGTYSVTEMTGVNPTTNEAWNTARDIVISVTEEADGTQKLEIKINQEILPIILEQAVSETVGDKTTSTITELVQSPLRVYYTVGIDSDVLLPNGDIDVSMIQGYKYIDDVNGTVSFYSNEFGNMNPMNNNGSVENGDAHVGFKPSLKNRYYYYQTNHSVFTKITEDATGNEVIIPENSEYGMVWDSSKYSLTRLSYDEYSSLSDTDKLYTYVTYYHPTPSTTDAPNAAEEVTYLVYADWVYIKESLTFIDANNGTYLNGGKAIPVDQVETVVNAYKQSNPGADLYAVLGNESLRTSRLHNMTVPKEANPTGTASVRYAPVYTYETASDHNGNDVVVWLGNNGKVTVKLDTGIALTKTVTENIGDPDDTYALTVKVPDGVVASPVVYDADGNKLNSDYTNNLLTVNVKAGQTVYVNGIPGGTECELGEIINGDYYIESKTDKVTVPLVSDAVNGGVQYARAVVTNSPNKYGNLFITKEITSDHAVPAGVLDETFKITVNVGKALAGSKFTVADSAHANTYEVTVDAEGNMVFEIKARQTIDIYNIPEGTVVTVKEELTTEQSGIFTGVTYRARNHSGENATETNDIASVTIPSSANATTVVINEYVPKATNVDIDLSINKNFADQSVASRLEGGEFKFLIQKYNTADKDWDDLKSVSIAYAANEYGTKSTVVENVLSGESFTSTGTYSYRVIEQKGSVTNVSYDRTIYNIDVVVTDNNGQLVANVIGNGNAEISDENADGSLDYTASFTNTYDTAPISMDITKAVNNLSGDKDVSAAGFKFRSVVADKDGVPLDPNEPETSFNTIFSDAAGEARISGVYTREQIGTHYYLVFEVDDNRPGWTYSGAQYFVTVVVEEDASTGKLVANMTVEPFNDAAKAEKAPVVTDNNKGELYFTNTYDPTDVTVDLDGSVKKELTGKTLTAGQFTFYVYGNGDRATVLLTGTNDLNGNVDFVDFNGVLTFNEVGKYEYDIVESIPAGATYDPASGKYMLDGMYYDATIFDFVVEVTNDEATGKLVANAYFEDSVDNTVTFKNSYRVAPTQYTLGGVKILHGRAPRDGEFSFELYEGNSLKETVVNKADGSFTFNAITYTAPGVYTYTIKEAAGSLPGVGYNGVHTPVTVNVTVTDKDGILTATASIANANIKFENMYNAKAAEVIIRGTKTLKGGDLENGDFLFEFYETDNTFDINGTNAELLSTAVNVNGLFTFANMFGTAGTYFLVVVENASSPIDDIVYDRTEHKFIVHVSDVGDGQLRAVVTNVATGVSSDPSASVSTGVAFTNAMFDEVTEKEVYIAGSVDTEIDGKKVNAGDILTYFISYTNYTGEDVVVDIMDTIPNYTSYVEGSASHDGTYVGTHVNWILNVPKGGSVTVSFDVRVDETEAIVANTATVRDGVNTYKTNEVVNHTVDNVVEKDVFAPEDPTVSIDGKKVYEGDELLYNISFTNTSGAPVDVTITDKIPQNTTYVDGSADNGGVYSNGEVKWTIDDVLAWETVTVAFKVKVNTGVGAVTIENKAVANDGKNNYETEIVTNYTVEDEVTKDVFNAVAPTVSVDGKKVYKDDMLIYAISYKNTGREKVTVEITDTVPQYTTYVEGSADKGGVYGEGKIKWTLDVEAGETVTVTFKVKVNDVKAETITNKAEAVEGKNTYTTNEVTSYTVEDETDKDVFLESKPTASIDGKDVKFGDILVYSISYKNTGNEKASITITDTIPDYTKYVDGSADKGGVYGDGKVVWNLDVEPGETVTVTFKVKVDYVRSATITNKAEIVEGRNTYTTNEVTNTTENKDPNVPQTGDGSNVGMWFAVLLVSGMGAFGLRFFKRKKATDK